MSPDFVSTAISFLADGMSPKAAATLLLRELLKLTGASSSWIVPGPEAPEGAEILPVSFEPHAPSPEPPLAVVRRVLESRKPVEGTASEPCWGFGLNSGEAIHGVLLLRPFRGPSALSPDGRLALQRIADLLCLILARIGPASHSQGVERDREAIPASNFLGSGPAHEALMRGIRSVSATSCHVLLLGETGTGKGLLAQEIHELSPRKKEPFVACNISALAGNLLLSELFGHKKGAFTGATEDHAGFFETVGAGTLLIDEIGDLEPELQKKILDVLQTRRFRRVGETRERPFRGRLVFATRRDLPQLVAHEKFRSDLFFRLMQTFFEVAPLRHRLPELRLLVPAILRKLPGRIGLDGPAPTHEPGPLELLETHSWPGNVRELEGWLAGLCAQFGPRIRLDQAREWLEAWKRFEGPILESGEPDVVKETIDALAQSSGDVVGAAHILRRTPPAVRKRVAKYCLQDHVRRKRDRRR